MQDITRDLENWVKNCKICQKAKISFSFNHSRNFRQNFFTLPVVTQFLWTHSVQKKHISAVINQIFYSVKNKFAEILVDKRFKRGIRNGTGTLFKAITGNSDAADGDFLTSSIDSPFHLLKKYGQCNVRSSRKPLIWKI